MAELSPDTLALWVAQDAATLSFRPLLDVAAEVLLVRMPGRSSEECADIAERLLIRMSESLKRIALDSIEDGVEPGFELSTDESALYFKSLETTAFSFRDQLLALSPSLFEDFCARLLRTLGGDSRVIGKSGDGGIDFVARDISVIGQPGPSSIGARTLIVGQAKRYSRENQITETDLRGFVGAAIKRCSDPGDVATYRRAILAPLSLAFWTTSDFQPSAKRYARAVGLWYLNGTGLAQLAIRLGVSASR
jgi:hypothetical protein